VSGYKVLSDTPASSTVQTISRTLTNTQQNVLIESYITPQLGFNIIPPGVQRFHLHLLKPASNDDIDVYATLQLADSAGTPIGSLITTSANYITWNSGNPSEVYVDIVFPSTPIDATNRMIVKLYLNNNDSTSHTVTYYTQATEYSYIITSVGVVAGTSGTSGTSGVSGSSGTSGDITLFNSFTSSINNFTSSIRSEIDGLEAYTASLKSAGLVSGSLIASSSYSVVSDNAKTMLLYSATQDFESYLLFSNAVAVPSTTIAGNNNIRYNSSTNKLTVGTVSATKYLGGVVSGSAQLTELNTYTGSNDNVISRILQTTASLNSYTASESSVVNQILQTTASLNTYTASNDDVRNNVLQTTASLNTYTGSNDNVISRILQTTASLNLKTGSYAVTGSNLFIGNQTITGSLIVSASTNLTGSVTINNSRIDNGWTAYTPQWTAASSNPAINNGTIEGYYKVIGKTCFVRGNIAMGSTTTFGSGEWYVSMPFTASHADAILMTVTLLDNTTAWYNAIMAGARAGFNHKAPIQYQNTGGTAADVNATAPFTWTTSDRFIWNGSYEIA
jgi:hypothetical protein